MLVQDVSVLVLDDVNAIRVQIKELLKAFGFKNVAIAASGEEGKRMLDEGSYHLVLSDMHMMPVDGMELLRHVRAHPKHKEMAFILVTADNTKEMVIHAIEQGVDDYLVKPLTLDRIQNKVYATLLKRKVI